MFAIVLALVGSAVAEDEVRIVIDEGVDGARPIAVVPFAGSAPEDIGKIVADDLRNSGKFNPIPVTQMPQKPTSASEVNPEAWSALGIDAVVVGQVTATGSGYNISYQLVDTVGASGNAGSVLAQNSYTVTNKWLRYGAHTVSDEVFEN
ncbi:protein TolB [Rodentibacter pneumotropicus]|uniref:Protein TolB n=1 Tax=Rodentibacter pneumotropicus TaxID=758 RepID=A0A448MLX0_9PAST|nr:protein TolB [Rodentibacter pneumotropicus]